jgi:hypothetical protein
LTIMTYRLDLDIVNRDSNGVVLPFRNSNKTIGNKIGNNSNNTLIEGWACQHF